MDKTYIAHINEKTKEIQTVKEHSENTAELCRKFAIPPLKDLSYVSGLFHDMGKFSKSFQERIRGKPIRVEHSTCGAQALKEHYGDSAMRWMMEYVIVGHHTGLPDGGNKGDDPGDPTLHARLERKFEDISAYKEAFAFPELDESALGHFLVADCQNDMGRLVDKVAFLIRYLFSCLVDADSMDTANFCKEGELPRDLHGDFHRCLEKINHKLNSFVCKTALQKSRALLQEQAFERAKEDAEIYLMNMPTGSGKTLASAKIALERALKGKKKRIIYVIPYNSIIDQTVEEFEKIFGKDMEILRHQSSFSFEEAEDKSEDYREAAKSAVENWDAPFIVTTAVQFFETVHGSKRGKLRKMHNIGDSILIFDEAHLMPEAYLQPCLQSVSYITRYLNSEAIFLTATMPDFSQLFRKYALPDMTMQELIQDKSAFVNFDKCKYRCIGETGADALLAKSAAYPSSLIIVNTKKKAKQLFKTCKLQERKVYHLSTYMTPFDRQRVLAEIKEQLQQLENDISKGEEIPDNRKVTIISTSLIEAGVDLDVFTVFRELSGLDSILQAGGRCNREGKRADAETFIFELREEEDKGIRAKSFKEAIAKNVIKSYENISDPACIEEYYSRLLSNPLMEEEAQKYVMHRQCTSFVDIPFRTYAENFRLIDGNTESVLVGRDEKSKALIQKLKTEGAVDVRKIQKYVCQLKQYELEDLYKQNAVKEYGNGIWCLENEDYYDKEEGMLFEGRTIIVDK